MRGLHEALASHTFTVTGQDLDMTRPDEAINRLGVDSVALLEIAMLMEDEFHIRVDFGDFDRMPSLQEFLDMLDAAIRSADADRSSPP